MRFNADLDAPLVARNYAPRTALPIPGVPIESEPSVNMKVNVQWFSHIIGIMNALDQPDAWQGTENAIEDARAEIRKLIASVETEAPTMTMPLGLVIPFAGKTTDIPSWLLLCDGAVKNRVDYPDLYDVLEAAFIIDDDTFKTPDLNAKFISGATSGGVGDTGGAATHTLKMSEMPVHNHRRGTNSAYILDASPLPPGLPGSDWNSNPASTFKAYQKEYTQDAGGGAAHNNLPPFLKLRYYIVAVQV